MAKLTMLPASRAPRMIGNSQSRFESLVVARLPLWLYRGPSKVRDALYVCHF